ncbi:hypothetical protein HXY32_00220 [Candidatus Bathyarchaeota archaeon]|nr:hypothetical protein [Candidatus Bathyarchaeota archaeon]
MNTPIIVIGLIILLIGLFIPIMYLGLVVLFAIVLIIIGLLMESEDEKIRRKRRICRICGKRITKEQAGSLGLCQACFKAEYEEDVLIEEELFGEDEYV